MPDAFADSENEAPALTVDPAERAVTGLTIVEPIILNDDGERIEAVEVRQRNAMLFDVGGILGGIEARSHVNISSDRYSARQQYS